MLWVAGLMLGYACLQWAGGSHLAVGHTVNFGNDLYFSAATMTTDGPASLVPARRPAPDGWSFAPLSATAGLRSIDI
ncbi:MAG: hypothetical protein ACYDHN_08790 [Solirubrobacteraceae bacterium]